MRSFLGVPAALSVWASSALALRLHFPLQNHTPGVHLQNLAGESFNVNQPGEHVLLRAPPESAQDPLIRVSAHFSAADKTPCAMYTDTVILKGDWLGNQTVRVSFVNRSLHIKVSSSSPARAGPWRNIQNYTPAQHGPEAIPKTLKIMKAADNSGLTFYAGPAKLPKRPLIKVKHGFGEGLDVSLTNLKGFDLPKVAGLLGSYKHNKTLENLTSACKADGQTMRKANKVETHHVETSSPAGSSAVRSTQLRNLAHESFAVNKAGEFVLLRVPKNKALPELIKAKGTFVATDCAFLLDKVTLTGAWFDNKTVYVSSDGKTFGIKVSSGKTQSIDKFVERDEGPEALPSTVKIATLTDGSDGPSFKFQVGTNGKIKQRASILVTQARNGLEISLAHMERTEVGQIGGLLGMDKHDKALDAPAAECLAPKAKPSQVKTPTVAVHEQQGSEGSLQGSDGSSLTASWTV